MECKRETARKTLTEQWKHSTISNTALQPVVLMWNHSNVMLILLFQHSLFPLSFSVFLFPFLLTISCCIFISSILHAMNKSFHPAHCETHYEEMTAETKKNFALEIIFGTLEIVCLNFYRFSNTTSIQSNKKYGNIFMYHPAW